METKSKTYVWIALAAIVAIAIIAVTFIPGGLVAKFGAAGTKSMSMTPMATKAFADNDMLYLAVTYDTSMLKDSSFTGMKMSMPKDLFANPMDTKVYVISGVSANNIASLDMMKTMINSGNMLKLNNDFTLTSSGNTYVVDTKATPNVTKNVDKVMTFVMVGKMSTNMMGKDTALIANMAKTGMMSTVTYKAKATA